MLVMEKGGIPDSLEAFPAMNLLDGNIRQRLDTSNTHDRRPCILTFVIEKLRNAEISRQGGGSGALGEASSRTGTTWSEPQGYFSDSIEAVTGLCMGSYKRVSRSNKARKSQGLGASFTKCGDHETSMCFTGATASLKNMKWPTNCLGLNCRSLPFQLIQLLVIRLCNKTKSGSALRCPAELRKASPPAHINYCSGDGFNRPL